MTTTSAIWPDGFQRIPDEPWVSSPVEELALNYDSVENHGWYSNLDHTVEQLAEYARRGDILIDYSGGTGIFPQRLLDRLGGREVGIVIVDSSPKFLRLALEKFRDDERVAFRWIRWVKEERRLLRVDEVLGDALLERGVDGIVSTNAVHLYFDLADTVRAWRDVLRSGGRLFVQSGNIRNPDMPDDEWIIDETVEVIQERARVIVRADDRYAPYRAVLDDDAWMTAHDDLRRKYFLPVRPLDEYLATFRGEGFEVTSVRRRRIAARVDEWYEFLAVYHEGVIGWLGGAEKVTGEAPAEEVVRDRLSLLRRAMDEVFDHAFEFGAAWTYITCEPRAE
ncbi:MAG: class I SAM-dependent methyltransferase [Longimicrobiales bacterium]|nr:class I SAM-dependent methyltransferase [Longimicrobiales bacterium]